MDQQPPSPAAVPYKSTYIYKANVKDTAIEKNGRTSQEEFDMPLIQRPPQPLDAAKTTQDESKEVPSTSVPSNKKPGPGLQKGSLRLPQEQRKQSPVVRRQASYSNRTQSPAQNDEKPRAQTVCSEPSKPASSRKRQSNLQVKAPSGIGPLPVGSTIVGHQSKSQHLTTDDIQLVSESLQQVDYYHGFMPRDEIETFLKKQGDFLLRATDHSHERRLAISVHWNGKPRHVLLSTTVKGWWFLAPTDCMPTVEQLIKHHQSKKLPVNVHGTIIKRPLARQKWQLLHEDIKEEKKLGHGAFGEVWAGTLRKHQRVAIKKLKTEGPVTKEQRKQFVAEARLMRLLDHENIVKVLGVAANEEPIMLVMELLPGGSLLGALRNKKEPPTPPLLERFLLDAVKGMAYLEKKKFIHRDLAARNCLLTEERRVKISDFGLSLVASGVHKELSAMKVPIKWLAPEVLTKMLYSHKSDVWAFGVMCWEVYSQGKEPYPGLNNGETKNKVVNDQYRMQLPLSMPKNTQKIVTEMWRALPEQRPSFEEIASRLLAKS